MKKLELSQQELIDLSMCLTTRISDVKSMLKSYLEEAKPDETIITLRQQYYDEFIRLEALSEKVWNKFGEAWKSE